MSDLLHNAPIRTDLYDGSLDGYQAAAQTTAIYPGKGQFMGLCYTALKGAGEAGEFAEKVGKIWRDQGGVLKAGDREALAKEIGDELWYLAAKASELGYKLSEIGVMNLTKLADRQQRGVLSGSGDNR